MRESELHQHIYARTGDMPANWPQVTVGPGDDCAVVQADGRQMIVTVDQLVEGRHFVAGTPIDLIARKAVARSVSDIAAMGGTTIGGWGLATGLLPPRFLHAAELTDALHKWAAHWGFPIVGGDIATASEPGTPLVLTVTIAGHPHAIRGPVLRSGARTGDELWVTGSFGGSLASGRHLSFEPRLRAGAWLCDALGADLHAMIDVSDGLGRDAGRLAISSGVAVEIDAERVPRHPDLNDALDALRDGEDYELCFAAAPGTRLPATAPDSIGLTRVGRFTSGSGAIAKMRGRTIDASQCGWDHAS